MLFRKSSNEVIKARYSSILVHVNTWKQRVYRSLIQHPGMQDTLNQARARHAKSCREFFWIIIYHWEHWLGMLEFGYKWFKWYVLVRGWKGLDPLRKLILKDFLDTYWMNLRVHILYIQWSGKGCRCVTDATLIGVNN